MTDLNIPKKGLKISCTSCLQDFHFRSRIYLLLKCQEIGYNIEISYNINIVNSPFSLKARPNSDNKLPFSEEKETD